MSCRDVCKNENKCTKIRKKVDQKEVLSDFNKMIQQNRQTKKNIWEVHNRDTKKCPQKTKINLKIEVEENTSESICKLGGRAGKFLHLPAKFGAFKDGLDSVNVTASWD